MGAVSEGLLSRFKRHPFRTAAGLFVLAVLFWHLLIVGEACIYRWVDPDPTPYMTLEKKRIAEEGKKVPFRHQWVPLSRMGSNIKRAVIASEDRKFLYHDGVDWEALQDAVEKRLERGKSGGASTITQQVVKNVFLTHEKSYVRKAREIVLSLVVDRIWPKSRTLEVYLNTAEFGEGIFGVQAAARYYFGCPASVLSPSQAAFLAAILPRPRYYQTHRNTRYITRRVALLLECMGEVPLRAAGKSVVR